MLYILSNRKYFTTRYEFWCLFCYASYGSLIALPLPFPVYRSIEKVMFYRMMNGLGLWSNDDQIVFIGGGCGYGRDNSYCRGSILTCIRPKALLPSRPPVVYCPRTYLLTIQVKTSRRLVGLPAFIVPSQWRNKIGCVLCFVCIAIKK